METIIYECGLSIYTRLSGNAPLQRDYVCILENPDDLTADQAFVKLLEILKDKEIKIKERCQHYIIAENNDTYTFANDRIYDASGIVTVKPSNILRHVFSRDFTVQSLYIDETGQTVDLTNQALNDIQNFRLMVNNGLTYKDLFKRNVDFLIDALYYRITQRLTFAGHLEEYIYSMNTDHLAKVDGSHPKIKKLIERDSKEFISVINSITNVSRYFYNVCGMKLIPSFGHPIEEEKPMTLKSKPIKDYAFFTEKIASEPIRYFTASDAIQSGNPGIINVPNHDFVDGPIREQTVPDTNTDNVVRITLLEIQHLNQRLDRLSPSSIEYNDVEAKIGELRGIVASRSIASNRGARLTPTNPAFGTNNSQGYKARRKI